MKERPNDTNSERRHGRPSRYHSSRRHRLTSSVCHAPDKMTVAYPLTAGERQHQRGLWKAIQDRGGCKERKIEKENETPLLLLSM